MAQSDGLGVGRFFSTGNEADLDLGELIQGLVEEGSTCAVLAYVEGTRDGARFEQALAAAQAHRVPVCVMKVGRSQRGAAAAASHTGALAGSDAVFDGVLRRYGMPRAVDVEQLLDLGRLFVTDKVAEGRKVSIVTISGGAGVLMTDYAEDLGLDVFEWTEDQQAKMAAILPPFASVTNPIDTTGAIASDQTMLTDALRVCVDNPQTDIAVILLGNLEMEEAAICERIIEVAASTPKPVLVAWVGGSGNPRRILTGAGVPTFGEPVRAMRAAAALATWSAALEQPGRPQSPGEPDGEQRAFLYGAAAEGRLMLDEVESKRVLAAAGVPVTRELEVGSAEDAVTAAQSLGYPVVVKLLSDEVEHKSDVGGVKLGLTSDEDVRTAAEEVLAVASRLGLRECRAVVQESVRGGAELIMGASIDPAFGPIVLVGAGGIFAEILGDVQIRPAPLTVDEAADMIGSLAAVELLRGARGLPVADERALARVVADFSVMVAATADVLESIDVNPLVVRPSGDVVALDGVVRLRRTEADRA
jgi:acyl-CoA synthetase (NDP forming)